MQRVKHALYNALRGCKRDVTGEFLKEHGKSREQTRINQQQERALAKQEQQIEKMTNLLRKQQTQLDKIGAKIQSATPTSRLADNQTASPQPATRQRALRLQRKLSRDHFG